MDMFSILTADAAAKHGHEFSRAATMPVGGQQTPKARLPIPRSPLSVLPRARSPNISRPRQRPQSMKITMAELKEDLEGEQADEEIERRKIDAKIRSFTIPGAFYDTPPSSSPAQSEEAPTPTPESELSIPIVTTTSDSTSPSASTGDTITTTTTTDTTFIRRNSHKPKIFYRLGRSVSNEKKILRPRVLLQVQEPRGIRSHRPVFDVVPGSRFNPRTKIGQKLRRLRRNKDGTGADDLVVVKSEELDVNEDRGRGQNRKLQDDEQETLNGREVLGTIQPAEDGPSAYLTLGDVVWKAALDGRGASYTLENANDPEQRVRWYVPKSKRTGDMSQGPREFSFATLLPGTKRHPIVANMSEGHLEFYEEFSSPLSPHETIKTDDAMRKLIIVSAMWVYFCEGWSKHYDFNTAVASATRPVLGRSLSMRSTNGGGLRGILRSPSRSPAPSVRGENCFSASSDTRSREGSHDSTATTVSPVGTIRHSMQHCSQIPTSQPGSRAASPEPNAKERRRWSIANHLRRFSHSMRHTKEQISPEQEGTIITADIIHVETLESPVDIEQHPLQKPFITTAKVIAQSTTTALTDYIHDLPPQRAPATRLKKVLIERTNSPIDMDDSPDLETIAQLPTPAWTPEVRTPEKMTASPISSDGDLHDAAWWQQYDNFVLRQQPAPIVIPTS